MLEWVWLFKTVALKEIKGQGLHEFQGTLGIDMRCNSLKPFGVG